MALVNVTKVMYDKRLRIVVIEDDSDPEKRIGFTLTRNRAMKAGLKSAEEIADFFDCDLKVFE